MTCPLPSPFPASPDRRLRRAGTSLLCLASLALASLPAAAQTARSPQLSDSAQKQIAGILSFKTGLSPAEQKLSTHLVLASRAARHVALGNLAPFTPSASRKAGGGLLVEISGSLSPSLMTSPAMHGVEMTNGAVPASSFAAGRVRAQVAAADLLTLASHPDVTSIREVSGAHTNVGSITSQGYIAHQANVVVNAGINGAGINVGVLSDSATPAEVQALIKTGDLPSNTVVLPGQADDGFGDDSNEGTAMMEIVHDMAPGANLFFATAFISEQSFADNIRALRFQYHCDIIVDDISYFDEPAFQDGIIAQAVNDVTADGALYFSSAANSGNLASGTSGTWEGDFTSAGTASSLISSAEGFPVPVNNFGTAAKPQAYDVLTSVASSGVYLHWADAQGKSDNDYDLFILDATGTTVKGFSADSQTGTQDPFEAVQPDPSCGTANPTGYCPAVGDQIVIVKYHGAARAMHIDTERATVSIGTDGATFGHNAGKSTFSVAATYWNSAGKGDVPFTGFANPVETFSSDGPRRIFFNPDGTPTSPGRYLFANGGSHLIKPDATAADGVFVRTPGFQPFFGTSAAAPHAAAIAALVKQANPKLSNTDIRYIMTNKTALDTMAPGVDPDAGYGIVVAPAAVKYAQSVK